MDIEAKIKEAQSNNEASYRVEENNAKLVLFVREGSGVIQSLDSLFANGLLNQVPSVYISGNNAIPSINIDGYLISPSVSKPEKAVRNGEHIYNFDYIKTNSLR